MNFTLSSFDKNTKGDAGKIYIDKENNKLYLYDDKKEEYIEIHKEERNTHHIEKGKTKNGRIIYWLVNSSNGKKIKQVAGKNLKKDYSGLILFNMIDLENITAEIIYDE